MKKYKAKVLKKYAHKTVKERFKESSSKTKCMYCEGKMSHVAYGDIEHFNPKYLYPQCAFVGTICYFFVKYVIKIHKKVHDTINEPILNPSLIDPEKYFSYNPVRENRGKKVLNAEQKEIAERKIEVLKLNRKGILYAHCNFEPTYRIFENHLQNQLRIFEKENSIPKRKKLIKGLYSSFNRIKK